MGQSLQDDYYEELADFVISLYINLCNQAKKRALHADELRLLNRVAHLNIRLWGKIG